MANENLYSKLDSIISLRNHLKFEPKSRDKKQEYLKFHSILEYCLNSLSSDYREIIEESYLNCDYKFWWVDKYCKSSFYRKRVKAITSFVHLFDLIYENYIHFSDNITRAI